MDGRNLKRIRLERQRSYLEKLGDTPHEAWKIITEFMAQDEQRKFASICKLTKYITDQMGLLDLILSTNALRLAPLMIHDRKINRGIHFIFTTRIEDEETDPLPKRVSHNIKDFIYTLRFIDFRFYPKHLAKPQTQAFNIYVPFDSSKDVTRI